MFCLVSFCLNQTLADLEIELGPSHLLSDQSTRWLNAISTPSDVNNILKQSNSQSSYQEVRTELIESEEKKRDLQTKARLCFQAKQYAVASYYSDETRKVQKKIEHLSRNIVDAHQSTS